jgi:hypothetical protein
VVAQPIISPVLLLTLLLTQANVYFESDSIIQRLHARITGAQSSIDLCYMVMDSSYLTTALVQARTRGVRIRFITENTEIDSPWVQGLRAAGIPVSSDSGHAASQTMHNKFAVFDYAGPAVAAGVWTGSFNVHAGSYHAENAIEVQDSGLAHAYTEEFEQMWGSAGPLPVPESARFHGQKTDVISRHEHVIGTDTFHVYAGPQNRVVDSVSAEVARARTEVAFCIFSFEYIPVALQMIARFDAGVWVGGAYDLSATSDTGIELLRSHGIPVYPDRFGGYLNRLHEKVMVIDRRTVITGSANWSNSANVSNDENLLVIHSPALAQRYLQEISRRFVEAGGTFPAFWSRLPSLPPGPRRRHVRSGGCLVAAPVDSRHREPGKDTENPLWSSSSPPRHQDTRKRNKGFTDCRCDICGPLPGSLYALKGNHTSEFYRFAAGNWESLPPVPDSSRKGVSRGAALAWAEDRAYVVKGGGNREFWSFTPAETGGTWTRLADVPGPGSRFGQSMVGFSVRDTPWVYLLKGANTRQFLRYDVTKDAWEQLPDASPGPDSTGFRAGSGLAFDGDRTIYALKGFSNEFLSYDLNYNAWRQLPGLPLTGRDRRTREGAGLAALGNTAYAIRGGRSREFLRYAGDSAVWSQLPDFTPSATPGSGSGTALALMNGAVYLLCGNNTNDVLYYAPAGTASSDALVGAEGSQTVGSSAYAGDAPRASSLRLEAFPTILRSPQTAIRIDYSLPFAGSYRLKLHSAGGELVGLLASGLRPAGTSSLTVSCPALPGGVYVLVLETGLAGATRKLILR